MEKVNINKEILKTIFIIDETGQGRGKTSPHKMEHRGRTAPYQLWARFCNLCLTEKLTILQADANSILNKRTELNGKRRLANKFKLRNFF